MHKDMDFFLLMQYPDAFLQPLRGVLRMQDAVSGEYVA
jgi:hypothetical protein